jgi:hypothetical protein
MHDQGGTGGRNDTRARRYATGAIQTDVVTRTPWMGKARAQWSGSVVASLGRAHPGRVEVWGVGTLCFADPTLDDHVWRMGTLRFAHPTLCSAHVSTPPWRQARACRPTAKMAKVECY